MKLKKLGIGVGVLVVLGVVGMFLPQEETTEVIETPIKQEQQKPTVTDEEYNSKRGYFEIHTSNRMSNITTTDLKVIKQEIELCNMFSREIMSYKNEYNLTDEQNEKLDIINQELNDINVSYNTNKVKIEKNNK